MLYTKICDSTITQTEQEEYLSNKTTIEDLYRYKEQGAYIRSRADFIEKKSNKYFYNKEKSFFEKKTVNSLTVNYFTLIYIVPHTLTQSVRTFKLY